MYDNPHSIAGSAAEIAPISVHFASSCNAGVAGIAVSWLEVELAVKLLLLLSVLLVFVLAKSLFERPWRRGDKENMLLHLRLAIVVKLQLLAVRLTFVLLNSFGPTTDDARNVYLCKVFCFCFRFN